MYLYKLVLIVTRVQLHVGMVISAMPKMVQTEQFHSKLYFYILIFIIIITN